MPRRHDRVCVTGALPLLLVLGGVGIPGCGLALDYDPPERGRDAMSSLDASVELDARDAAMDVPMRADAPHDGPVADARVSDTGEEPDVSVRPDAAIGPDTPPRARGECDTDADCPGGTCVELASGGYRVCRVPREPATGCTGTFDDCCTTADCVTGTCFLGPVHRGCGGATPIPANECALDECERAGDCPLGICAPAGTFAPIATCLLAACLRDSDCVAAAGGVCVLARDPCCGVERGLVCSYPSDGCLTDADCPGGYCDSDGGRTVCRHGVPLCPG